MNRSFRLGLGILLTSWVVAVGCGDDDDGDNGSSGSGGDSGAGGSGAQGGSAPNGGNTTDAGSDSVAGSDAGGAPAVVAECAALGRICHAVDDVDGPLHECHELGHANDLAVCLESFASCIAACRAATPAGEGGAGGGGSGGAPAEAGAGGGAAASPYCEALIGLCEPVDDTDGPLSDCLAVGQSADAADCEASFDECAPQCLAAGDAG